MKDSASTRLLELGLTLPGLRAPVGNFVMAKRHGDLLYLSGQGPNVEGGVKISGKVGDTVGVEEAYQHARLVTLNLLAAADNYLGSLDRIDNIIKVHGFVNAAPDFTAHPSVINGCSDLLVALFGPVRGSHARSAIGVASLPTQITVEIEMIVSCR
jgi:enamine deaminase RidA (YjgF/YER057c/UK114 family)